MKALFTPSRTLATSLLLGLGIAASAQSLGDARAEAWIGQPLLVTVPAGMEVGGREDCVHADVFYGDSRVSASQVRASLIGQGSARRVRIESDQPIDEPVVTVSLRAGCTNTMTRSYTLLPELPSAAMLAAANVPPPPFQASSRMSRALATQASGASSARPVRTAEAVARPRPVAKSIVKVRQPRVTQTAATTAGPRLRLENWEPDPQTMLRVSSFLSSPQEGAARATAALLWQALNAGPEQILRTSATLQQLEGELAQLRQTAGQTQSEMLALRRELEAPPAFGLPTRAMQLLAVLLALAAATAAFLWYRTARGGGEWSGAPIDSVLDGLAAAPQPVVEEAPHAPQAPAQRAMPEPVAAAPVQRSAVPVRPALVPVRPAPQVRAPSATMMRVETLSATFEEVDFLASLGLWSDAMDILKTYLEDSAAPAPLAYYELMRLCVHTDDGASLVQVRKRYAQVFGVESPKFEQINAPLGVESYPELANRICGAWGTPEALDFIELSLFTVAPAGKAFSLEAGRDLLFLHDLAMALVRDSGAGSDEEDIHALAPWARSDDPEQARMAAQASADSTGGHRFGLDLDLNIAAGPGDDSALAPLELVAPKAPDPADPFATGLSPLQEDHDPFSAAVAGERMRRI